MADEERAVEPGALRTRAETAKDVARELALAENYVEFKELDLALAKAHRGFWACAVREDRPGMEAAEKVADARLAALDAHIRERTKAVFEHQAALEACGDRQEGGSDG